ncbi:hypothetical protein BDC45DRAFT_540116 [Circinella umbellata]|nr:hypothetical protein BDC45DRAFT_540116 [Circinella umbellata]
MPIAKITLPIKRPSSAKMKKYPPPIIRKNPAATNYTLYIPQIFDEKVASTINTYQRLVTIKQELKKFFSCSIAISVLVYYISGIICKKNIFILVVKLLKKYREVTWVAINHPEAVMSISLFYKMNCHT